MEEKRNGWLNEDAIDVSGDAGGCKCRRSDIFGSGRFPKPSRTALGKFNHG